MFNVRIAVLAVVAAAVSLLAPSAATHAREWHMEMAAGPVDEIDGKRTGAAMLSWVSDDRHPHEISIGYLHERSFADGPGSPRVTMISATRRLTWGRWFWVNGVALIDGQSEALSSFYQFINGPGWQGDRVTISFRHMSNANLRGRNRGENLLLIGWRF